MNTSATHIAAEGARPRTGSRLELFRIVTTGTVLALVVVGILQRLHAGVHEAHELPPLLHWLRDSLLAAPLGALSVWAVSLPRTRRLASSLLPGRRADGFAARLLWALLGAAILALGSVPGNYLHGQLSEAELGESMPFLLHAARDASAALFVAFTLLLALALVLGTPWEARHQRLSTSGRRGPAFAAIGLATGLLLLASGTAAPDLAQARPAAVVCERNLTADVVALDQPFDYNRLGATNPEGMMYALREDAVSTNGGALSPGNVKLRESKRPRPLVLRMNVGDCLRIEFENLLSPAAHNGQPADRHVGVHVNGLLYVNSETDGGSFVGENESGLVAPGESTTYTLHAEHENTYLLDNLGVTVGGEGNGGTMAYGLFGAVNVEPRGSVWYRSQVTREDMDLASTGETPGGQPVIDYEAIYPDDFHVGSLAGRPVLNMLDSANRIAHSDLTAIISGPASNGYRLPPADYPASYWDNQVYNMGEQRGAEPFREFTIIFHDEINGVQAFPEFFENEAFESTLHGVRDGFAINYGAGGAGAEIIANRLGVGPMGKCVDCKYEEFFLTSWAVGDPAMVVDNPADAPGPATKAFYPDDPSNVYDSYLNDRVKFRNLHAGPKEHHIFHLHAHQWTFTPNTKKSTYLDSQLVGPGSGYTYEIAFGGSGNRNKGAGDAIFHCHFYPHFAQGMWSLWRNHDVFERGTQLDPATGRPVAGSRALPDGEITAGTPIPALVPLPGRPMAPMPADETTVVPYDLDGDGTLDSSQLDVNGDNTADFEQGFPAADANAGFPFFIPGVAGHRPPTPPLDMPVDGGLPRHMVVDGEATQYQTRLDFNKTLTKARLLYLPEAGTPAEQAAMDFHADLWHPTSTPGGTPVTSGSPMTSPSGRLIKGFETNGLPPVPGAPYADPCRSDSTNAGVFKYPDKRTYKATVVQVDSKLNKLGWHFPQQRFEVLDEDVGSTLRGKKAPEPLVVRLNAGDCANLSHTNLVPDTYELDDYQVRTPTDIIGQHIHLVKFDVTSADGSGNGFNYEDGTLSPQDVVERVKAVRAENGCSGSELGDDGTLTCPKAELHPYFGTIQAPGLNGPKGPRPDSLSWGARTTIQRWYADPVLNDSWDKGHGAVFTHDHFGPSTHQQVGLYSTVLVEPEGSQWRDPETGASMYSRGDGGPTSWKADIITSPTADSHREFYLEFADFQHAYQASGGKLHTQDNGAGVQIPSYADFKNAINPSFRQVPPAGNEADLHFFPGGCANGAPRPCPEAISADDVGTFVVNMRNEPIGLRVFDPNKTDPATGLPAPGQATGPKGDLAEAFQTRTDRAIAALNTQPNFYSPLTKDVRAGDPWTPLLRVYAGDRVRIRAQVGATEEEHNLTIHGLKWRQEELHMNSGWRNTQAGGISEYFNLELPVMPDIGPGNPAAIDYQYEMGHATDDLWNGIWGFLRAYNKGRSDLQRLPNNTIPSNGWPIANQSSYDQTCPKSAPSRTLGVTAVRAADVLGPHGLVYNEQGGSVTLIDPTAILYVYTEDLVRDGAGQPIGLAPGTPVEPLVLRANAGDCIKVTLTNKLPATIQDQPGLNVLPPIVHKNENVNGGIVTFNNNDLTPSSLVGLHPQLVAYDPRRASGGFDSGSNSTSLVAPGQSRTYLWYAGDLDWTIANGKVTLISRPVEFGAVGLMPADAIKGTEKGMVGALVVEPPGANITLDPGTRLSATVSYSGGSFREFVTVLQTDVNLRYGGCAPNASLSCAVPGIAAEAALGPAEDAEDAGQKAINYGAEPLWLRLGVSPTAPFEQIRDIATVHNLYSSDAFGDPQTAVFTAHPGEQIRIRLVEPGGHARGAVFTLNGHSWAREPYADNSDRITASNDVSQWVGAQEGIAPSSHFDFVVPRAGGPARIPGDYLFRDAASFGSYQGLWGIVRVQP